MVGSGCWDRYFSIYLFWKLDAGLTKAIRNREKRRTHIVRNMIYMVELQEENITTLRALFGDDANIICADYLADDAVFDTTFDYVIGNPPYNKNGIKKVPTNRTKNKKCDGTTLWFEFVKKSVIAPQGGWNAADDCSVALDETRQGGRLRLYYPT